MHSTGPDTGTIYLIHLDTPYKHARHYTGWTTDLEARLQAHRNGHGARLMQVITEAGITWRLARTWPGGRARERAIKDRHEAPRLCPECTAPPGQHRPVRHLARPGPPRPGRHHPRPPAPAAAGPVRGRHPARRAVPHSAGRMDRPAAHRLLPVRHRPLPRQDPPHPRRTGMVPRLHRTHHPAHHPDHHGRTLPRSPLRQRGRPSGSRGHPMTPPPLTAIPASTRP